MGVKLVSETPEDQERTRLLLRSVEELQPTRVEPPERPRPPSRETVMELMGVLARILGFRLQLFLAFSGAAAIGGYAAYQGSAMGLVAFGLYAALVFLPVLWVAYRRG